jgi:dUTP pyrophosphatase
MEDLLMDTKVRVKKLKALARVPVYMTGGAAGCDLEACLDDELLSIPPMGRMAVPTGLAVQIPEGYEIQIRPRSGLAFKQGLTVINAPGTIDSDYRGEIKILVVNLSDKEVVIRSGDRIAQMVLNEVCRVEWEETDSLEDSARAAGGFGSTGIHNSPNH